MNRTSLIEAAQGVWQIPLLGEMVNAYLIGDILVDAGIRASAGPLQQALQHQKLRAHALTHAHPDHQGASHAICAERKIPLWVHQQEAELMSQGHIQRNIPKNLITLLQKQFWAGPGHTVDHGLKAGDDLNGFEVIETPGHSLGHISLWRESDGVLIAGDVLTNVNVLTTQKGLHLPLGAFTLSPGQNQSQIHRLAKLQPRITLFGHGSPLRDPEALLRFAEGLPKTRIKLAV